MLTAILVIMFPHDCTLSHLVDVYCNEQVCEDYRNQFPCEEPAKECMPNATTLSNGVILPFPGQCNCCDYCLTYYAKGEDCVSDGIPIAPNAICGAGLTCDKTSKKCIDLDTPCTRLQKKYVLARENGTLGFTQVYPQCDDKGEFSPTHCIRGSICYCMSSEGERIFGEAVYSSPEIQSNMKCECSRAAWKAEKTLGSKGFVSFAHCLEDGNYDPLQCVGLRCWCLNTKDSAIDIKQTAVLVTNLRIGVPSCFDPSRHQEGKYKIECEVAHDAAALVVNKLWSDNIVPVGMHSAQCQYDGYYERVLITDTEKKCVDKNGKYLGYTVSRDDSLADGMDCNCARTRLLLSQAQEMELPDCCKNGNFKQLQCRRGKCFCVDHNGNQIVKEVSEKDLKELSCNTDECAIANSTYK